MRRSAYDRLIWVRVARAHDLAGRPDSAIVWYEKYLSSADAQDYSDARWQAPAHRWVGELYAQRGDNQRAIEHLDKFVAQWSKAEPELQPQVREARARLEGLRKKAG